MVVLHVLLVGAFCFYLYRCVSVVLLDDITLYLINTRFTQLA